MTVPASAFVQMTYEFRNPQGGLHTPVVGEVLRIVRTEILMLAQESYEGAVSQQWLTRYIVG